MKAIIKILLFCIAAGSCITSFGIYGKENASDYMYICIQSLHF